MRPDSPARSTAILAIAYARVSKEDQAAPDRASLSQQHAANVATAERLDAELVRTFTDAGASGGTDDRPEFQAMIAWCEAHPQPRAQPGYVLVLNDSRWGRWHEPERGAYWRVRLSDVGWRVRYAENDDPGADIGTRTVMRALHGVQATNYRNAVRANARRGSRGTAAQGYWQTEAPIGYRRCAMDPSGRSRVLDVGQRKGDAERVRLTPGPDSEVALVRELFTRYATGTVSLGSLCREMQTRWPGRIWKATTLHVLLRNPAYAGDVVWCRRSNDDTGRQTRTAGDWVIVRDAHPALVERALWDRVQAQLALNRRETSPTQGGYPLTGMIHCASCGRHYIGGGGRRGPAEDPDRYRFYRDYGAEIGVCPGKTGTITKHLVETAVVNAVGEAIASPEMQQRLEQALEYRLASMGGNPAQRQRALEAERRQLEAQRDRLTRALAAGTVQEAEVARVMADIREQLFSVAAASQALRFTQRRLGPARAEIRRLAATTRDFPAMLARLSGREQREHLKPWIESAIFDKASRLLTLGLRPMPALSLGLSVWAGRD